MKRDVVTMGAQQVKDRSGGSVGGVTTNNTLGAGTSIRASRIKPRGTAPKDARNIGIGSNIFTEHSGKFKCSAAIHSFIHSLFHAVYVQRLYFFVIIVFGNRPVVSRTGSTINTHENDLASKTCPDIQLEFKLHIFISMRSEWRRETWRRVQTKLS